MAHVVETGAIVTGANAYMTAADADTYHTDHENPSSWSSATDSAKEKSIRLATQYLDAVYRQAFIGYRKSSNQVLEWPRVGAKTTDGFVLSGSAIPQAIKDACAELALKDLDGTALLPDLTSPGSVVEEDKQIGPLRKRIKYAGAQSPYTRFSLIDGILQQVLETQATMERG